jgi:hypothetical protein
MTANDREQPNRKPLRAIVEIVGGELSIIPIADCDTDERDVLDALRVFLGKNGDRPASDY